MTPTKVSVYLEYRTYGRQMQDPDLAFQQMRDDLQMLYPIRATFREIEEEYWPLSPEQVGDTEKKGIFVMRTGEKYEVVVRSLPVEITCDHLAHAEMVVDTILEKFPGKFAVVQLVKSYLTNVFAE